jgi:NDP-sugar pyrophosphorylase family protein
MITDLVLLSGGLATRLRPISHSIPKSLIDINGTPFIEYQLKLLKEQGIENIVICVGYLGEQIEDLIGDGNKFGLNIRYSYDGDRLLGTAGAIKKALPYLPETFFIMYGDSYLPINFEEVSKLFTTSDKPALMTVIKNDNQWDKSNVIFSENNVIKYDKVNIVPEMNFIDYGLGIVTKTCFNCVGDGEVYDLANIYRDLAEGGKLLGFETEQRFYEVGSFDGIEEFKKIITKK